MCYGDHSKAAMVLVEKKGPHRMESTPFAPASERYMIDHMNADHADANLMYVKVYGKLWEATAARLLRLDKTGMELEVTSPAGIHCIRLTFDHCLHDEQDAEHTLAAMARHAQAVLADRGQLNS
jgi:putative heme iron utilization protein